MAKIIKKNIDVALAVGIGLFLLIVSVIGINEMVVVNFADAATTDTAQITVSATVAQTISINVSSSALSLGTLTIGSVSATNTNFTVKTNAGNGYTVSIKDVGDTTNGGLYNTTSTHLIASNESASSTLTAGTEGYGVQGTTSDADVNIYPLYNWWEGTNNVGPIKITDLDFCSSSSPTLGDVSGIYIRTAITAITAAGTYEDIITLTATGSF